MGMICWIAQDFQGFQGIDHGRKDTTETVGAIEPLYEPICGFFHGTPPHTTRKEEFQKPSRFIQSQKQAVQRRTDGEVVLHLLGRCSKQLQDVDLPRVLGPGF